MSPSSKDGAPFGGLRRLVVAAGVLTLLAGAGVAVALSLASPAAGTEGESPLPPKPPAQVKSRVMGRHAPKPAIVATAIRQVWVYRHPGARHAFTHFVTTNGYGQPRVSP